jgi:hypothetical protein
VSKDGAWKYFLAQLCYKCNDRLYELEQENKQYAILRAHDGFFKCMKEYENFKHRLVYELIPREAQDEFETVAQYDDFTDIVR